MDEDAVVIFTSCTPDQIQEGVVTINIFVPDIRPFGDGTSVQDGARCEEVEAMAQAWFDSLSACSSLYKFHLRDTIKSVHDVDIRQSFVVVKLGFRFFDE